MQSLTTWKVATDDILKERDTIMDDMEVDTETNIDEPWTIVYSGRP